jgi:hypothetical protein
MQKELEVTRTLKPDELKLLADVEGPCLTLILPGGRSTGPSVKNALRSAEQRLADQGVPANSIRQLVDPLISVLSDDDQRGSKNGGSVVVLRSKDVLRAFELNYPLDDAVHVCEHFQIRPALRSLSEDRLEFYLLALSQNRVRLLRCTLHDSVELPWPKGVPASVEEWLNTRLPNSPPDHGAVQPSDSSTAGSFTSTTDRDKTDEHLANFYRAVNRGITDHLKDQTVPMILCGVEYERSMYQAINTYGTLVEAGVQGSPESLKGGEMHKRALEIAQQHAKEPMKKALAIYEKLGGTERVSAKPAEILKGAHEGRIAYLFVGDGASYNGRFDTGAMKVRNDGPQEDLINLAALRTIAYGGEVWTTVPGRIPEQAPMAAIFRF